MMSPAKVDRTKKPSPFVCDVAECNKTFTRMYDLQRHRRIHCEYGDRQFRCQVEGCFFRANQLAGLKVHANSIHLGIRMRCDEPGCDKTFSDPSSRNKHRQRFHRQHSRSETSIGLEDKPIVFLENISAESSRELRSQSMETSASAGPSNSAASSEPTDSAAPSISRYPSESVDSFNSLESLESTEPSESAEPSDDLDPPVFQYTLESTIPPVPEYFPLPHRPGSQDISLLHGLIKNDYYIPCTHRTTKPNYSQSSSFYIHNNSYNRRLSD
ncbi:hypothetical protein CPB83DRAFT_857413 [Crepidotus variabilis]|uniref:C2H2-type domain-containing protein n=1 Tax=Crepidotus variabilis TaxID=179855 RepID=A0A9P6ECQ4_9AGAR|nr:hypothetical protein CPB83DRAFT_857413 [Crepidotus variabilis]